MAVIVINILKIPTIKTRLQIPDYAVKTETKFSKESRKDSVLSTITSTYKEKRIKATISDAESINARAFHEAGRAKIVKTFKYDPTKAVKSS
ncbi:hypothetical protein EB796_005473 [Bugula neritina]|uniref:Uncharacterized protein n=1 Tax=Bugula neritina TaxID=10212 RepID=A0A7J7KC64_BUGNE|nr:hypothetical protein EB796_005473 [Bugula neritina]